MARNNKWVHVDDVNDIIGSLDYADWRINRAIDELYRDENGNPVKDHPRCLVNVLRFDGHESILISASVTDEAGNVSKETRKVVVGDDALAESIGGLLDMSEEEGLYLTMVENDGMTVLMYSDDPRCPKNNVYENEKG